MSDNKIIRDNGEVDLWLIFIRVITVVLVPALGYATIEIIGMRREVDKLSIQMKSLSELNKRYNKHETILAHLGQTQWNAGVKEQLNNINLEVGYSDPGFSKSI